MENVDKCPQCGADGTCIELGDAGEHNLYEDYECTECDCSWRVEYEPARRTQ